MHRQFWGHYHFAPAGGSVRAEAPWSREGLAVLGSLGAKLTLGDVHAQAPAKVMPRTFRVALENDKLRVLEFTGRPGMGICGEGMQQFAHRFRQM